MTVATRRRLPDRRENWTSLAPERRVVVVVRLVEEYLRSAQRLPVLCRALLLLLLLLQKPIDYWLHLISWYGYAVMVYLNNLFGVEVFQGSEAVSSTESTAAIEVLFTEASVFGSWTKVRTWMGPTSVTKF